MADHLHPAIDIPGGGLWEGACVAHSEGDGVCVEDQRGCHAVLCVLYDDDGEARLAHPSVVGLSLRLDDPLGLAGLAGRVAERAGIEWAPADGIDDLAETLADERWAPIPWRYWYEDGLSAQVIREAATLLARLDRLVAAAWPAGECRCLPGAVPTWERGLAGGLTPAWLLTCGPCGVAAWLLTDHPGLDTPDPIEAAGAALEVC